MGWEYHELANSAAGEWRTARSFDDLLELGRRFVRGELEEFPGWGSSTLDEESDALEDALLGAHAMGVLTVASQPGRPFGPGFDGEIWGGRAFVCGFAAPKTLASLRERAVALGMWCLVNEGDAESEGAVEIVAGLRGGVPYLVLSPEARAAELEIFRDALDDSAFTSLQTCGYLAVVDPAWGRRERLDHLFGTRSAVSSLPSNGARRPT